MTCSSFPDSVRKKQLHVLTQQPVNEVSPEDGDPLLAGIMDKLPVIGHWRQPFCNRQTPAHFPARETKISKTGLTDLLDLRCIISKHASTSP
jgi:hypothetical protein